MKKPKIPIRPRQLENFGIRLMPLSVVEDRKPGIHRDEHYMFIIQKKGELVLEVDFNKIELMGAALCFVAPGQIHQYIYQNESEGWFLFADTIAVPESYREILDMDQWIRQSIAVDIHDIVFEMLPILEKIEWDSSLNGSSVQLSLAEAVMGLIVSKRKNSLLSQSQNNGQKYPITKSFKTLLKQEYKENKQVQQYARSLSITPLYLNEAVKEVTGYPPSYWIQQKVILEACRLLVYTEMDVKQIAYELGYEDAIYFSRFFKKGTGMTALQFRMKNQDLSHNSR